MRELFGDIYRKRKVLVTGHTGFKGTWLMLYLQSLGAEVFGFSLKPETDPNHFSLLKLDVAEKTADIRDYEAVDHWVRKCKPEIIFHLAAQSLVRRSYRRPLYTLQTNILGTANVLEACVSSDSVRTVVIITSDKCYENNEQIWAYREKDPMGGYDPYSASKGCAELVIACYRSSYFKQDAEKGDRKALIASCRAGNVIGGGDWAEDRLVPDIMRAIERGEKVYLRNPISKRPWQHVLDPLSGYLLLGQSLLQNQYDFADCWNFGPIGEDDFTVKEVVDYLKHSWGKIDYYFDNNNEVRLHEAGQLKLDCSKAKSLLRWKPVWNSKDAFAYTAEWYKNYYESDIVSSREQLETYIEDAFAAGSQWTKSEK